MSVPEPFVRATIDSDTKQRAADAPQETGLPTADALRSLMQRVAEEHRSPTAVDAPNTTTRKDKK